MKYIFIVRTKLVKILLNIFQSSRPSTIILGVNRRCICAQAVAGQIMGMGAIQAARRRMRMRLLTAGQIPAIIGMYMADEGILVPGDLVAHVALGFVRPQVGVLVVIGILSPKHNGIVGLALFGHPLGRVGHISCDLHFPVQGLGIRI